MHNEYGPFHNALQAGAQSPGCGAPRKLGHETRHAETADPPGVRQTKDTDVHRGCMTVSFAFRNKGRRELYQTHALYSEAQPCGRKAVNQYYRSEHQLPLGMPR